MLFFDEMRLLGDDLVVCDFDATALADGIGWGARAHRRARKGRRS